MPGARKDDESEGVEGGAEGLVEEELDESGFEAEVSCFVGLGSEVVSVFFLEEGCELRRVGKVVSSHSW